MNTRKELKLWYQSLPTFNDQPPRSLDSFNQNEKFEDNFFVAGGPDSLISQNVYQEIIKNYNLNPDDKDYQKEKIKADD